MLWVTRLDRRQALVYLGLAQLAAGTLDLASCAVGWNNPAFLAGWLAVTGGCVLWDSGRRASDRDDSGSPSFIPSLVFARPSR